jgi:PAS domain S-box-containing protein
VLLECYPEGTGETLPSQTAARNVRAVARLARDEGMTLAAFTRQLADRVRDVTGYDRVMVYRFGPGGAGEVVAESRAGDVSDAYEGLWYPASDIPPQARALYLRKRVRLLGDVDAQPVPLVPAINPATGRPTDLGHATLRAFSPVHLQYLRNMGVRATLVLSVVKDDRLWGLIACHHRTPRWVAPEVLDTCDLLAELLGVQVALVENVDRAHASARVRQAATQLRRAVAEARDWPEALVAGGVTLLDVVDAVGAAVVRGDDVWTVGATPPPDDVRAVARWLATQAPADAGDADRVVAEDALGRREPRFAGLSERASGLLAAEIARAEGAYVLWFRPEWVHTVAWAGAPGKVEQAADGAARLLPRESFAAWAEEVRGAARPWSDADRTAAGLLRSALVDEVLHLLAFQHLVLRRELLRARQAVEASAEAMAVADPHGRTLFANSAYARLFGVGPDDVRRGRAFNVFDVPCDDPAALTAARATLARAAGTWRGELWMRTAGGARVPVELRLDRINDETGQLIGIVAAFGDLRERHRAAEERRALEAKMLQAQKLESLGVLAGGIAHDFNNLLTGILGNASLARLDLAPSAPALEYVAQIETAARRAAELCRQMLAYAGKGKLSVGPVDLNLVIAEMRRLLDTVLSKRATLRVTAAAGLPSVQGDATQLRQVLMNLLTNASDALGDADGTIAVTTDVVRPAPGDLAGYVAGDDLPAGDYVRVRVSDTGSGMDAATRARIFDPFFTTKFTGRGLGLAAVIGIVRGHGGGIRVDSAPGRGTSFSLLFPAAGGPVSALPAAAEAPVRGAAGRVALVVDDDAGVRAVAARSLRHAGFEVYEAADGHEAVAVFAPRADRVDLVVLDLVMPGMGGEETLRALQALRPDVRVLMSSGYTEEDAMGRFAGAGVAGFVQKPYTAADLMAHAVTVAELPGAVGRAGP